MCRCARAPSEAFERSTQPISLTPDPLVGQEEGPTSGTETGDISKFRAELDLDKIREVRYVWQFFRDRRPETYEGLVQL